MAIVRDGWQRGGLERAGQAGELLPRFARFAPQARALLAIPDSWQKWALFDRPPGASARTRPGDAARRCRASDAAVPRARRRHGDRGRGRAGGLPARRDRGPRARVSRLRARARPPRRPRAARGAAQFRGAITSPARSACARDHVLLRLDGRRNAACAATIWLYDWKGALTAHDSSNEETHVRDHHRRKPAEARHGSPSRTSSGRSGARRRRARRRARPMRRCSR